MIESFGNMLHTPCEVLVITTNGYVNKKGECVMGRGIASQIKGLMPSIPFELGSLIGEHGNVCQVIHYPTEELVGYVSFPVKPTTVTCNNDKSNVVPHAQSYYGKGDVVAGYHSVAMTDIIEKSCRELVDLADKNGWTDVLCPRFGCGAGELEWEQVKKIVEPILDDRFTIMTYEVQEMTGLNMNPKTRTVFLSGSSSVFVITSEVERKIRDLQNNDEIIHFIVGDCHGADHTFQKLFSLNNWSNLTVYYSGNNPRKNLHYKTKHIPSSGKGREFYTTKDKIMSEECDEAIVMWNGRSQGSLSNIQRLKLIGKDVLISIYDKNLKNSDTI